MKKISVIISAMLVLLSCGKQVVVETTGKPILIKLTSENHSAIRNEVSIEFHNVSDEPVTICPWPKENAQTGDCIMSFDISCDGDEELVFSYHGPLVKTPHPREFVEIEAKKKYVDTIDLNRFYVFKGRKGGAEERIWKKGSFTISCIYEYNHEENYRYGRDLWEGWQASNEIVFAIEKDNEKYVIYNSTYSDIELYQDMQRSVEGLKEYAKQYGFEIVEAGCCDVDFAYKFIDGDKTEEIESIYTDIDLLESAKEFFKLNR